MLAERLRNRTRCPNIRLSVKSPKLFGCRAMITSITAITRLLRLLSHPSRQALRPV
ncbi:hypothetical protein NP493_915g00012 [Ridgeia piscesae]|uniref:Uncharacterized protein n=1 Tax=Ridgeia piscesae TaxID=27915 RepID=A0AAD9KKA0_RIDPI|nr:hypothetical protein NP493_915g00012 [Ridgeia piscesae]